MASRCQTPALDPRHLLPDRIHHRNRRTRGQKRAVERGDSAIGLILAAPVIRLLDEDPDRLFLARARLIKRQPGWWRELPRSLWLRGLLPAVVS